MDKKQLKKLAALVDAPVWFVKESLGIPIEKCPAHSLEGAALSLETADDGSDEERAAFILIEELLSASLAKRPSLEKLKEIFSVAHRFMKGSQLEKDILDKWDKESLSLIKASKKDVSKLANICLHSPHYGKARKEAIQKIAKLNFESLSSND